MPKKIKLEDGSEIEIPTDEEQKDLEEKVKAGEEATTKVEALTKENEELKETPSNQAFVGLRKENSEMKKALDEKGITTDKDGKVSEEAKPLTAEDIERITTETTNKTLLDSHLAGALKGVDSEKAELIKKNYEKLTAGEEVSLENVDQFISGAVNASGIKPEDSPLNKAIGGSQPKDISGTGGGDDKKFTDTEEGKGLASDLGLDIGGEKKEEKKED